MKRVRQTRGMRELCIHMGLFDFTVAVVTGPYANLAKYIQWKHENPTYMQSEAAPRGRCHFTRGYVPVIWIPRYPKTPREHATLAHEALHAVFHIFDWADLPRTSDTEEVATHAMGFIVASVLEHMR